MNKILVLIDMQPHFVASQNLQTIDACREQIRYAIDNKWYIFFVQWIGEGNTDHRLTSVTKGYKFTNLIFKDQNDGAVEIMNSVREIGIVNPKFRVCGVNTDACVLQTVNGLAGYGKRGKKVEVVARACHSDYDHAEGIRKMNNVLNVTVI